MPKNIVIFSDGTGQEGGRGNNTNVYKLFNMIEHRTPAQMAFYDRGVGTSVLNKLSGLAGGRGFGRNVRDCYRFIFEHYESGDRLFLIGFSRGAATVRSLSYFIHLFGILPHSRPELIEKAWDIYEIGEESKRRERSAAFIDRHSTMWTEVHFLGCFDTVAALGLPFRSASVVLDGLPGFRHRFHNFRLSPSVVHAYHALALDDERLTFHPLLWDPIDDIYEAKLPAAERSRCRILRQVWFAGMHTDVGGGYAEPQLSDIPLVWMTGRAFEHGLRIHAHHRVGIDEDCDGVMHDSRGGRFSRFYRRAPRSWDGKRRDRPVVHESVLTRKPGLTNRPDPKYAPWVTAADKLEIEPWVRYAAQPWHPSRLLADREVPAGG